MPLNLFTLLVQRFILKFYLSNNNLRQDSYFLMRVHFNIIFITFEPFDGTILDENGWKLKNLNKTLPREQWSERPLRCVWLFAMQMTLEPWNPNISGSRKQLPLLLHLNLSNLFEYIIWRCTSPCQHDFAAICVIFN